VYNGSTATGIGRTAGHLFEPGRRACQGPRTDGGTGGTATDACTVPVAVRPSSVDVTLRPGQLTSELRALPGAAGLRFRARLRIPARHTRVTAASRVGRRRGRRGGAQTAQTSFG
jgi:hypothetical protein